MTKPVTLSIDSVETTAMGFRTTANTRIDRYAFGITAAKGMASRNLTVELVAVAESALTQRPTTDIPTSPTRGVLSDAEHRLLLSSALRLTDGCPNSAHE